MQEGRNYPIVFCSSKAKENPHVSSGVAGRVLRKKEKTKTMP